jgi:hypothetical protein
MAAIGILADAIKLLLKHRIDTEVAREHGGRPAGSGFASESPETPKRWSVKSPK